ncbi:aspartate--tRNA(Asn) ligase [Sporanaerobium hydrogeniformans]|uniref:Aspartate--tRNA(Asn) ligase n=1 Tax=Sporanaerobium hydrogeniformans TaxID=3072179 RepID=A0AC61DBC4_9FIRM|nr:aspartate--tRNA(Asn) ligase [Sporanaerobium hydrogeniformans]PHV70579.1 aspartate--tRNA(Asn) ligase [Sporanaerobium hydrogeniformans]
MLTMDGVKRIKWINIEEIKRQVDSVVTIDACIHKIRSMSEFAFIILRTGRYLIQGIYEKDRCGDSIEQLKVGCYVKVKGHVREDERAILGFEILLTEIKILSSPQGEYPLNVSHKKLGCGLEANLDNRSVALRNPYERAIFKIQEGVVSGFREFMLKEGFTQVFTPKIVAAGAEGGANIFKLDYFNQEAYLAQSPQFYKQTCVAFFDRVFEIAPVYRAEKHNTSRHLNEYIGLDFEMGYIESMYDVMEMETAMLKYTLEYLYTHYKEYLEILGVTLPVVDTIPSLTFMEALEVLKGKGGKNKYDLEPEDEVFLYEYAKENWGSEFIFITHFPASKRPFYAMNDKEDPRFALSFDLLFRGLEITTGGQRIHDYNEQVAKMKEMGMHPEEFYHYLNIHKYGMPPHGGLGIGLERLVMKLLDLQNIRQASMFPRDVHRLEP